MAEGQVGAAIGASEVPIYYVPKPNQPPNVFAQLMSGFLQTRNPAAMMLFEARLREMDPGARVAEILRAAEADAAQQRAMINFAIAQQQGRDSIAKTLLTTGVMARGQDVQASIEAEKLREARRAKAFDPTPEAQDLIQKVTSTLLDAIESANSGDIDQRNFWLAEANRILSPPAGEPGGLSSLTNDQQGVVRRKVSEYIQGFTDDGDQARDIHRDLGLEVAPPYTPPEVRVGAGAWDPMAALDRAGLVQPDGTVVPETTSSSTSVRGPAPAQSSLPAPSSTPTEGGAATTEQMSAGAGPASATLQMPASPGSVLQAVLNAQKNMKGLGPIGSPIYTRPAKRDGALEAFQRAAAAAGKPAKPTGQVEAPSTESMIEEGKAPESRTGPVDVRRFLPTPRSGAPAGPKVPLKDEAFSVGGKQYQERDGKVYEAGTNAAIEEFSPEWEALQKARSVEAEAYKNPDLAALDRWKKRSAGGYA